VVALKEVLELKNVGALQASSVALEELVIMVVAIMKTIVLLQMESLL
jgi:hypothetical protein